MSPWRQLTRGLRALTHRSATDLDVADEVQHYLEQATAGHIARGLSPDEALRAARLELGGVTNTREQVRGYGWENAVDQVLTDMRYALRTLRKNPGFTLVAVLSLGFGIGATTTVFSVIDALDFRPLPYRDADRLVWLSEITPRDYQLCFPGARCAFQTASSTAADWISQTRSYEAVAAQSRTGFSWEHDDVIETPGAGQATPGFFSFLGVRPLLGREFLPSDTMPGAEPVLLLTYDFWQKRLGGDPRIVGSRLLSNYGRGIAPALRPIVVIGVLPEDFGFVGNYQVWVPMKVESSATRSRRETNVIGRLKRGQSLAAANTELETISARLGLTYTEAYSGWGAGVQPLRTLVVYGATAGKGRLVLFAVTTLVLFIAVLNIAGLLLGRGAARAQEFAMRSALGAGRMRLVRQLLVEGACVGFGGGLIGILLAFWGERVAGQWFSIATAGLTVDIDHRMLAFAVTVSLIVGVGAAIAPAIRAARTELISKLRGRTAAGAGARAMRASNALITLQIALALMLLTAAGLLSADFLDVRFVDLGYDPTGLYSTSISGNPGAVGRSDWLEGHP